MCGSFPEKNGLLLSSAFPPRFLASIEKYIRCGFYLRRRYFLPFKTFMLCNAPLCALFKPLSVCGPFLFFILFDFFFQWKTGQTRNWREEEKGKEKRKPLKTCGSVWFGSLQFFCPLFNPFSTYNPLILVKNEKKEK